MCVLRVSVAIITTVFTTAICTSRDADDVMCSALDVDAVAADLQSSQLITTPPTDVESGINCYNSTLRALIDKHAPVVIKRTSHSNIVRHQLAGMMVNVVT